MSKRYAEKRMEKRKEKASHILSTRRRGRTTLVGCIEGLVGIVVVLVGLWFTGKNMWIVLILV